MTVDRRNPQGDTTLVPIKYPREDGGLTLEANYLSNGDNAGHFGNKTCRYVIRDAELRGAAAILRHVSTFPCGIAVRLRFYPFYLIIDSRLVHSGTGSPLPYMYDWSQSIAELTRTSHDCECYSTNSDKSGRVRLETIESRGQPISDKTIAYDTWPQLLRGLEYLGQPVKAPYPTLDEFTVEVGKALDNNTAEPKVANFNRLLDVLYWLPKVEECCDRSLCSSDGRLAPPGQRCGEVDDDASFQDVSFGSIESTSSLFAHQHDDDVVVALAPDKTYTELSKRNDFDTDLDRKWQFITGLYRWPRISDIPLELVKARAYTLDASSRQAIVRNMMTIAHKLPLETPRLWGKYDANHEVLVSQMDKRHMYMIEAVLPRDRSASLGGESGIVHSSYVVGPLLGMARTFFEKSKIPASLVPGWTRRIIMPLVDKTARKHTNATKALQSGQKSHHISISNSATPELCSTSSDESKSGPECMPELSVSPSGPDLTDVPRKRIKTGPVESLRHVTENPLPLPAQDADPVHNGKGQSSRKAGKQPNREKRPGGQGSRKRHRFQDDSDGDACSDSEDQDRRAKGTRTPEDTAPALVNRRLFACHYWKNNPEKHQGCFSLELTDTGRVKQHLRLKHYPNFPCHKCKDYFRTQKDFDIHAKGEKCILRESAQLDCMTKTQAEKVSRRSDFTHKSHEDVWYDLWVILFGDKTKPMSPYKDQTYYGNVYQFMAYCKLYLASEVRKKLSNHPHEAAVVGKASENSRLDSALKESIDSLYRSWISTDEPHTDVPDSVSPKQNRVPVKSSGQTDKSSGLINRGSDSGVQSMWSAKPGNQAVGEDCTTAGTEPQLGEALKDASEERVDQEEHVMAGLNEDEWPPWACGPTDPCLSEAVDPYVNPMDIFLRSDDVADRLLLYHHQELEDDVRFHK